jgi:hypothetical protein
MTTETKPSTIQKLLSQGYWVDIFQVLLAVVVVVVGGIAL